MIIQLNDQCIFNINIYQTPVDPVHCRSSTSSIMSSASGSTARKRANPSNNDDRKFVFLTRMSTEGEFGDDNQIGGVYSNKYAANMALLKHDGILNGHQSVDELEFSYDDDDLIQVVGTIGEGESINWRVEKYAVQRDVCSAEECDKLAEGLADEMGATYEPRHGDAKRTKRDEAEE